MEEWKAWVAVTLMPPTWALSALHGSAQRSRPPGVAGKTMISKLETVLAPVCPQERLPRTSKWSKWPWVMSMVSSSPTRLRSSGVCGLFGQEEGL